MSDEKTDEGPEDVWSGLQWMIAPALELLATLGINPGLGRAEAWLPLVSAVRSLLLTSIALVARARRIVRGGELSELGDLLDDAGAILVTSGRELVDAFPDVAELLVGVEALEEIERAIMSTQAGRAVALAALEALERRADILIGRLLDTLLSPSTPEQLERMTELIEHLEGLAQRIIDEVIVPRVERSISRTYGPSDEEE